MSIALPSLRPQSHALTQAELRAADAVGALMELWGFRRQLGRVWTVLFLSERPLPAPELCERLQISTGLLSMSLAELRRWGVVRGVSVRGERKEHYQAETHVWKMVRRVLRERERLALEEALTVFESALAALREAQSDVDPGVKAAARHRLDRVGQLVTLTRTGLGLLGILLESARVDLGPLQAFSDALSGRDRPAAPGPAPSWRGRAGARTG
ncbi:MAG TPA: ArsR family transcriptional regulator [Anaeromyxobacteraceae bacterium]|nr:ArsR family transcriptional regulator [Anaeromyxobacteraceae bacterium]